MPRNLSDIFSLKWRKIALLAIFLFLIIFPYVWASVSSGSRYVFGGFLINPIDGNSYLAKMYQGFRGDFTFKLPYTSQPGEGAYLFIFYLLLGHISRIFNFSLISVYHGFRIVGAMVLVVMLYRFASLFVDNEGDKIKSMVLLTLGSGLGWMVVFLNMFTMDYWVAEAYPFLSAFSSPHFSWGLAGLLFILDFSNQRAFIDGLPFKQVILSGALVAFLLSLLSPFAIVLSLIILGLWFCWEVFDGKKLYRWVRLRPRMSQDVHDRFTSFRGKVYWLTARIAGVILGGLPFSVYYLYIVRLHPALSVWNSQNITLTPGIWDFVLSFSPALLLAVPAITLSIKHKHINLRLLVVWTAVGILLAYFPFTLQRRFLFGFYIPVVLLAIFTMKQLKGLMSALWRWVLLLSLPTNILIMVSIMQAINSHNPKIYLTNSEHEALVWISTNTPADTLILASPDMGLYIPAHTGRRVVYGHPFETVNAQQMESFAIEFYTNYREKPSLYIQKLRKSGVKYIFYGPREMELGIVFQTSGIIQVYRQGEVTIFLVQEDATTFQ